MAETTIQTSKFGRRVFPIEETQEAIAKAHSKEPKTYIATQNGIDHKQGFIAEGTRFSTTQPQGEWMELVEDEPKAKSKGKAKKDDE